MGQVTARRALEVASARHAAELLRRESEMQQLQATAAAQHAAELLRRESEMQQLQAAAAAQHAAELAQRESEMQQLQAELVGGVAMQCNYEARQACHHVFARISRGVRQQAARAALEVATAQREAVVQQQPVSPEGSGVSASGASLLVLPAPLFAPGVQLLVASQP